MNEKHKDSKEPWPQTSWNSFGLQLLDDVNTEHVKQKDHPLFHEKGFLAAVVHHTTDVLTELIKRLQRAEGIAAGLPNTRSTYTQTSVISLNRFLTKTSKTLFIRAFKDYRISLDETIVDIHKGNAKKKGVIDPDDVQKNLPKASRYSPSTASVPPWKNI
ncbi:hypothetical protein NHF46_11740 [Arthrobacter alpinus]|nr:hypothetical protein [Arthrobacter alpinus]